MPTSSENVCFQGYFGSPASGPSGLILTHNGRRLVDMCSLADRLTTARHDGHVSCPIRLVEGLNTRLEPVEDLQGSLVNGRYNAVPHSIKRRAEISVGLRHASLL
jgi:hypothetical protein